jgi:hypothetical protein
MRQPYVLPESIRSFHDYFNLTASVELIAEALGYQFHRSALALPSTVEEPVWVSALGDRLTRILPHIALDSEAARRELLIAPVLVELTAALGLELRIEFDVRVSERLHGDLDYLLQTGDHRLLVVEAKNADTSRGMSQLVAEIAALDQWMISEEPILYGALSTGDLWRFARLDRGTKTITQDVNLFRVPADLAELSRVLVGILSNATH